MTTTVETPDEMLARLDRMGLDRVKSLITRGHFEEKTVPLVEGWITRRERELLGSMPEPATPNQKLHKLVEHVSRQAHQAKVDATAAQGLAHKAQRTALIAIIVAAIGGIVSILSLFALAVR